MDEESMCPNCCDGIVYLKCDDCNGQGVQFQEGARTGSIDGSATCGTCGGAGELKQEKPCAACEGKGVVTRSLAKLIHANSRMEKAWDGRDHGITQFSLAKYYRERDRMRRETASVVITDDPEVCCRVQLRDHKNQLLTAYRGFCTGYGGEGPNGLGVVLVDLGFFEDQDSAMRYVARLKKSDYPARLMKNPPATTGV